MEVKRRNSSRDASHISRASGTNVSYTSSFSAIKTNIMRFKNKDGRTTAKKQQEGSTTRRSTNLATPAGKIVKGSALKTMSINLENVNTTTPKQTVPSKTSPRKTFTARPATTARG